MGNRAYALMTGLFVLILGAATVIVAHWLAGRDVERVSYTVVATEDVSGLYEASQVFYRGVPVGKVEAIRFNPQEVREILIRISLDRHIPVTRGTYATLRPQGITGLTQLALQDKGGDLRRLPTTEANPGRIPLRPGLLEKLSGTGEEMLVGVNELVARLNALLDEKNRTRIANSLAHLEAATARLTRLENDLSTALSVLPGLANEARATLGHTNRFLTRVDARLDTLTQSLHRATEAGKKIGDELATNAVPHLNQTLAELADAGKELRHLASFLRDNPQSLLYGRPVYPPGPGEEGYRRTSP